MNTKVQKKSKRFEKVLKIILNTIIALNTIYVIACADNQDVTIFFLPACIYFVTGFLRIYVREFSQYLTDQQ